MKPICSVSKLVILQQQNCPLQRHKIFRIGIDLFNVAYSKQITSAEYNYCPTRIKHIYGKVLASTRLAAHKVVEVITPDAASDHNDW